jgi:D-alanyl-D-alanine carboxypeptidase
MQAFIQGRNVIMVLLDSKGKMSRTADAGRVRHWLENLKPSHLIEAVTPSATAAPMPVSNSAVAPPLSSGVGMPTSINTTVNASPALPSMSAAPTTMTTTTGTTVATAPGH